MEPTARCQIWQVHPPTQDFFTPLLNKLDCLLQCLSTDVLQWGVTLAKIALSSSFVDCWQLRFAVSLLQLPLCVVQLDALVLRASPILAKLLQAQAKTQSQSADACLILRFIARLNQGFSGLARCDLLLRWKD